MRLSPASLHALFELIDLLTCGSAICLPVAVFLWVVGLLILVGLPNYYRQTPGKVPSFYKSVFRRKIILWNLAVVVIQNWFLSAPYGRNWSCESPSTKNPPYTVMY